MCNEENILKSLVNKRSNYEGIEYSLFAFFLILLLVIVVSRKKSDKLYEIKDLE